MQKADGTFGTVEAVAFVHQPQVMYNLTVDQAHTFFVGDGQWLVHNKCARPVDDIPHPVGSLTRCTDSWLKKQGIDPHEVKEGLPGSASWFDIYKDKKGTLFALRKGAPQSTAIWLGHLDDFGR